jgi:hypothetical protein
MNLNCALNKELEPRIKGFLGVVPLLDERMPNEEPYGSDLNRRQEEHEDKKIHHARPIPQALQVAPRFMLAPPR